MDQLVKRMLKLIEEDADSFAKKAELYFKKRPELIGLVEDFYRMYRALAERYDHVTGELRKSLPSDLQSQGSGISDVGSEPPSTMPSPDRRPSRTKSGPRAAGFDVFLGSAGSGSDLNSKEGDETSTLDSESESDDSSVNNYSGTQSNGEEQGLRRRNIELEFELREVKEKLRMQQEEISQGCKKPHYENSEVSAKIAAYEEELRVAKEKIQLSEDEITRLMVELQKYESMGDANNLVFKQNDQQSTSGSEAEVGMTNRIQTLEEELKITREKLLESENEAASLRQELTSKGSSMQNWQDQLKSAQKEVSVWKNKVEREKREISKLQDRIVRYKTNLSERDQEIRGLKEAISNANKSLSEENEQLQAEMTRLTKERAYLEDNLKELDLRCQSLEEEVRRVKAAKAEMERVFGAQIEQLNADIAERDGRVEDLNNRLEALAAVRDDLNAKIASLAAEMSSKNDQMAQMSLHLHQLHMQHIELITAAEVARESAEELRSRVKELETEVERKQETILEGAEEKREAIRQLCFSLEHYRSGYNQLRQAVIAHRRPAVLAT
ncbi:protein NETWORKED 4A [Sesamum angolense]|uniref:Protein NETWORKED 4A n=1 Tax=Sesamum angolense TaxID=2727404 RepID=A0AAE1XC13_9LAMI|nr:protein NETWORKED 4A [Sesamum angolense]